MENFLNENPDFLSQYIIPWGIKFVSAILIYIIGRWIARLIVKSVVKIMSKSNVDASLTKFAGNIISAVLTIFILIAAIEQLGVDTTSIMAVFAAAGLAVGLALKDSLSNFSAGIMLIMFKPFKLGDLVTAGGSTGVIEDIQIFNTVMRTGDNQEIIIPNGHIYGGSIINISARETRRIDLIIGIGYDDNIGISKQLIEDIISKNTLILTDPAPTIMVLNLGESSIDIAVRPWVKTADYWIVRADLLQTIKETFDEKGISIPYPQRDVHMITNPVEKVA